MADLRNGPPLPRQQALQSTRAVSALRPGPSRPAVTEDGAEAIGELIPDCVRDGLSVSNAAPSTTCRGVLQADPPQDTAAQVQGPAQRWDDPPAALADRPTDGPVMAGDRPVSAITSGHVCTGDPVTHAKYRTPPRGREVIGIACLVPSSDLAGPGLPRGPPMVAAQQDAATALRASARSAEISANARSRMAHRPS